LGQKKKYLPAWPVNEATANIAFSWLLLLRWGAVACQAILIFAAYAYLAIAIPMTIVLAIIGFQAGSNLFFTYLQRRKKVIPDWLFGLVMFLDVIFLTMLLFFTGGPLNPFAFLYLIHIVLAAVLMRPKWSWSLMGFTVICYGSLFMEDSELMGRLALDMPVGFIGAAEFQRVCHSSIAEYALLSDPMKLHLKGMLLAFAISAFFIVFFVGRIQKALEEHQQTLASLEEERARSEKLASLATFSAGAAHEFATPLATIAVAAGEMVHQLKGGQIDQGLIADAELIKQQVKTCKDILYQMAADAGEHLGEAPEMYAVAQVVEQALAIFPVKERARIMLENTTSDLRVLVPVRTLVRTLKGLLQNAIDTSPPESDIVLRCFCDKNFLYFQVTDHGAGMDKEVAARATEPFFSTKGQEKGLGLGLFLARNMAEQLGGRLDIASERLTGTTVTISFAFQHIGLGSSPHA